MIVDSAIVLIKYIKSIIGWYLRYPKRYMEGRALRKFKNIHKGERCFIIATGPSLLLQDVEKLQDEITFGVNSIIGFFDKTTWRPTYYGIIDANTYAAIDISRLEGLNVVFYHSVLPYPYKNGFKVPVRLSQTCYHDSDLQKKYPQLFPWTKFSEDIVKGVWDGRTVVYSMLQIAAYMGFSEIYLLGADCDYKGKERHAKDLEYDSKATIMDPNVVVKYMIECYKVADIYQKTHNIKIYNATRGGMLEVFERVDLDKVLER